MSKHSSPSLIKTHRVYTTWEAAETLGKHRQTVLRWIKHKGLHADTTCKPWLIQGADLKDFLGQRRAKARCRLKPHHFYCLGCKGPREPDGKIADYVQQTDATGMLTALCPTCGNVMNKIVSRAGLETIRAKIEVTFQQASPRLVSCEDAHLNVTFEKEAQTHAKAQR